jgi:hypothetical protein
MSAPLPTETSPTCRTSRDVNWYSFLTPIFSSLRRGLFRRSRVSVGAKQAGFWPNSDARDGADGPRDGQGRGVGRSEHHRPTATSDARSRAGPAHGTDLAHPGEVRGRQVGQDLAQLDEETTEAHVAGAARNYIRRQGARTAGYRLAARQVSEADQLGAERSAALGR